MTKSRVEDSCNKCHKFFSKKYNYDIHVRRKVPCKEILYNNIAQIEIGKLEEDNMFPNDAKNTILETKFTHMETDGNQMEIENQCLICKDLGP